MRVRVIEHDLLQIQTFPQLHVVSVKVVAGIACAQLGKVPSLFPEKGVYLARIDPVLADKILIQPGYGRKPIRPSHRHH